MLYSRIAPMIAAAAITGCTPYDPDLGPSPFLCGDREPRCPDGYVCVERVGNDKVCLLDDVVSDAGNDGNLQCSGDAALEPNETIEMPTLVPIPEAGDTHMLAAVICPTNDRDIYRLNVDTTGKNVRIEASYDSTQGQLVIALLNSTGTLIRAGTPTNNDPNKLRADFANLAEGTYYGRVESMDVRLNYDVTFIATADALPP